jgi:CrcB protein
MTPAENRERAMARAPLKPTRGKDGVRRRWMALLGQMAWVMLGAAAGGALRYFVSGFVGRRIGEAFPWGTLVVNVTGAFAIGAMAAAVRAPVSDAWLFGATGLLGAYTTVSSFSLQTLALVREGGVRQALNNVALSLALCIGAAALGYAAATTVVHGHG